MIIIHHNLRVGIVVTILVFYDNSVWIAHYAHSSYDKIIIV